MSRRSLVLLPMPFDFFPEINGDLWWWIHPDTNSSVVYDTGTLVNRINPKGGTITVPLEKISDVGRGNRAAATNSRSGLIGYRSYQAGNLTTFSFLHNKTVPYVTMTVFNTTVASTLYHTFLGGNGSGKIIGLNTNGSISTAIRNGNGTSSVDLFNLSSATGAFTLGTWNLLIDKFYGYQDATGNDQEIWLNNNGSATITVANCATSSFSGTPQTNILTYGNAVSNNMSMATTFIVTFPTQTRSEIDTEIAELKAFINSIFKLW